MSAGEQYLLQIAERNRCRWVFTAGFKLVILILYLIPELAEGIVQL
jgi:hypothetical protein